VSQKSNEIAAQMQSQYTYEPVGDFAGSPFDQLMSEWLTAGASAQNTVAFQWCGMADLDEMVQIAEQKLDTPIYANDARLFAFKHALENEFVRRDEQSR
jgi:uncharacterized protein involved in cysteine biosynthesis